MQPETPAKVMSSLIDLSSRINREDNVKAAMAELRIQHRTHQQMIGSTLFTLIKELATLYNSEEKSRYFDGRNDCFGRVCSDIDAAMTTQYHSSWNNLPFI